MSIGAVGGGNSMMSSLLMKALDQDKSGTASLEEFTAAGQSVAAGSFDQSDDALAKAFSALDADQDGALTKDEIAQGLAKFSQDTAGALLGAQEAGGQPPPPPPGGPGGPGGQGGGFFTEADADGSGSVSLEEFTAAGPKSASTDEVESLFDEIDQDGDGEISSSEDEAFRSAQGPQGPGGPPPPPPGADAGASEDDGDEASDQLAASLSALLGARGTYGSSSAGLFDQALSGLFSASA